EAGDELLADDLAGDAGGVGVGALGVAAEDAEEFVRGFGEAVGLEEALEVAEEGGGGAEDVEVSLFLGGGEGVPLADLVLQGRGHGTLRRLPVATVFRRHGAGA